MRSPVGPRTYIIGVGPRHHRRCAHVHLCIPHVPQHGYGALPSRMGLPHHPSSLANDFRSRNITWRATHTQVKQSTRVTENKFR